MNESTDIITFREFVSWVATLNDLDESLWVKPISEGKWSVSESVSHIMNWDHYLLAQILPSVKKGEDMVFPDFDTYNNLAIDYAKSGITKSELIKEVINAREQLVIQLLELPVDKRNKHIAVNGVSHCPHTGTPYSLAYIVKEFIQHDNHHKEQIVSFLSNERIE
ncbi:UNVERIFIED_CONTAM: putative damage-inducible protein DinB [Brevibacillus sp. OAP136]